MEMEKQKINTKPQLSDYPTPVAFVQARLQYRKQMDKNFSILKETKKLRRVSPALVSLILAGKRQLTLERVDEFAILLQLSPSEKSYLRNWLENQESPEKRPLHDWQPKNRRATSVHLLNDWLNVYVKDAFEDEIVQKNPERVFSLLSTLAPRKRIEKSLQFLLREGYLKKTLDQRVVPDVPLMVVDPQISSQKIRAFHRAALKLAMEAVEIHSPQERLANTLILSMDESRYQELCSLIQEFSEKLQSFAAESKGPRLYQMIVNLSPTGGKHQ
jgi:uncharacterized protein (TIGR02147 family)